MIQLVAIFSDSLRHLRSRSLFWISLALSAVMAIALFGLIHFNDKGMQILWFKTQESEWLRAGTSGPRELMSWMFNGVYVFWWLSWGAIVLALLSTASILPEFLASGTIDMTLAKPISRLKLLFAKFSGALLFVALQALIAVGLAFILLGANVGLWLPKMFWAVPLLVLQFMYLYSMSALTAVVTRSTMASLLVTVVFWALISIAQFASNKVDEQVAQSREMVRLIGQRIERIENRAKEQDRDLTGAEQKLIGGTLNPMVESSKTTIEFLQDWQRPLQAIELTVPKTGDMQKIVANITEAPTIGELLLNAGAFSERNMGAAGFGDAEFMRDVQKASAVGAKVSREVQPWSSIGSSMVVVALTLALAALVFLRRDF